MNATEPHQAAEEILLTAEDPALPQGRPGYLWVSLNADGHIEFRGSRPEVERFLDACAELGIELQLAYLSWCG